VCVENLGFHEHIFMHSGLELIAHTRHGHSFVCADDIDFIFMRYFAEIKENKVGKEGMEIIVFLRVIGDVFDKSSGYSMLTLFFGNKF